MVTLVFCCTPKENFLTCIDYESGFLAKPLRTCKRLSWDGLLSECLGIPKYHSTSALLPNFFHLLSTVYNLNN